MKTISIILFLALPVFAHDHREHGAHQHGHGEMSIAFEGNKGKVEIHSPSESIFGFEHSANSKKDKIAQKEGLEKLEKNISEMLVFDSTLGCKIKKENVGVKQDSTSLHSDTEASYSVECIKSPKGTKITFNLQKFFPRLKDVDVQILVDTIQKSVEANKNGTSVELN